MLGLVKRAWGRIWCSLGYHAWRPVATDKVRDGLHTVHMDAQRIRACTRCPRVEKEWAHVTYEWLEQHEYEKWVGSGRTMGIVHANTGEIMIPDALKKRLGTEDLEGTEIGHKGP